MYQVLLAKFSQLKTSVKLHETNKDATMVKFRDNLEAYVTGLRVDVSNLKTKIRTPVLLCVGTQMATAKEMIQTLSEEAASLAHRVRSCSGYQDRFDDCHFSMHSLTMEEITQIVFTEISDIQSDLSLRKLLWETREEWGTLFRGWKNCFLHAIDVESIQKNVFKCMHTILSLEKGLPANDVLTNLKQSVTEFKHKLPVIVALGNPHLKPRHWEALQEITGKSVTLSKSHTIEDLLNHQDLVHEWTNNLTVFSYALEEWMTCQRNWLHVEPVFNCLEIQRQLPEETKVFSQVISTWKEITSKLQNRLNALQIIISKRIPEILKNCNKHLEFIKKRLEDYLEMKRMIFPRFYFLSTDELLAILAGSRNPESVQPHLVKCFENVKQLMICKQEIGPSTIRMLMSAEGEGLVLHKKIHVRSAVEQWLANVEKSMFEALKKE
ncbi:dynein heavy chain 6, axonemal-like isoform X2 [Ochotona curzoniae]|uniref:dynein heavy chain 6, axonemal-like isoform X2 n=1 Tax=Ochotona curzoniae TaxID=130825 RepID=UPI001B3535FC|nr:dynein heavy chain 6, axonemal-like isoform X2 [Ochotona curzoniae]